MEFSDRSVGALLTFTFVIAALHALIPSHWLAFVLVGRAQRWTHGRTLAIAALAGAGHIVTTIALGLILTVGGKALHKVLPEGLDHAAASVLLVALGLYFIFRARRGDHVCAHPHDHEGEEKFEQRLEADMTAVGALVLGLTLSPCLELLPVFLAAAGLSWTMLLVVSLVMTLTTLSIMLLLVWLTLHGLERLNLRWLEKNEGVLIGGILIALGVVILLL
jgi:nickel/cobalt exporter